MTAAVLSLSVCIPAFAQDKGTGDPGDGEVEASQVEDDRDCSDFNTQDEAQDFFESEGGPEEDPHRLDADNDGEACEESFGEGGASGESGDSGDRDCADFASQQEAQDFFESEGGPEEDPHRLDADNDGQACEDSDFGGGGVGSDGDVPEGGIASGFGPTTGQQEPRDAHPLLLGALVLA